MRIAIIAENKKIITAVQLFALDTSVEHLEIFFTVEAALLYGERYKKIDMIIIDVDFLKSFCWELLVKLRVIKPNLKFVFLAKTGKDATKAYDYDIDDYIVKPVTKERLKQSLEKISIKINIKAVEKVLVPAMREIKISCLKKFQIIVDGKALKWKGRKAEELVAYLIENREISVHKEKILEDMWPEYDYEKGLKILHMTVFRARQSMAGLKDYINIHHALDYYRITVENCSCEWDIIDKIANKIVVPVPEMLVKIFNWYRGNAYLEENGWLWSYTRAAVYEKKMRDYIDVAEVDFV